MNIKKAFHMEEDHLPPLKTLSVISFSLLIISTPLFAFTDGPGQYIREYVGLYGIFSCTSLFQNFQYRSGGRRAGTYWIVLDVLSGMMYLNNLYGIMGDLTLGTATVSLSLPNITRYAAHIFEGLWLISSAMTTKDRVIQLCGICAGCLLALYSFVCPFAPAWMLTLNVPFMLVWFYRIVRGRY